MTTTDTRHGREGTGQVLADTQAMVDPALRAAVDRLPNPMRRVAGYHFGWLDEHGNPTTASPVGKAIRPALTLLCAAAVGDHPPAAMPAAIAVELVHNFSLLHDDVMDGDDLRRHRRTVWAVFGIPTAVLAGDALLALALTVLADSGHPHASAGMRMVSAVLGDLVDGQSADTAFELRTEVGMPECLAMAAAKTGALLGCSCALGTLFGGGSDEQVECLREFGEQLGLAFQLVDDMLGIWGDPGVTGKPVGSDLARRKKTLPVVAALGSGCAAGEELAALYRLDRTMTDAEVARAARLVDLAGGRTWAQDQAEDRVSRARTLLQSASLHPHAAAELDAVTRTITLRRY